jgi:hypothetical protein
MPATRDSRTLRPNELSITLVPNRLSVLEGQAPGRVPARAGTVDTPLRPRSAAAPGRRATRRISASTIMTAAIFLIIIVSRIAGDLGTTPSVEPTTAPGRVPAAAESGAPAGPGDQATPGNVIFGRQQATDCRIARAATEFRTAEGVWWTATLATPREAGEQVRWLVVRAGMVQAEGVGPTHPPGASWDLLCGNEPLMLGPAGQYRLEVRSLDRDLPLAAGTFVVD